MERKQLFNTRLDENVIIIMLAVSVLAAIIFAFKVKSFEPCGSFEIHAKVQGYTGEPIPFETTARSYKSLLWDFGDHKKGESGKAFTDHIYDQEGKYTVSLLVNNSCPEYITVTISQPPPVYNPQLAATFTYLPQKVEAGKRIAFKDTTKGAYRWEWYFDFGESDKVDDTSQTPSHVYKTPGLKRVSLRINHNPNWFRTDEILVDDPIQIPVVNNSNDTKRPHPGQIPNGPGHASLGEQLHPATEPLPAQPTGAAVTPQELEEELRGVANHLPQYTMEYFYRYTCNSSNIQVNLNGKTTTFDDVYNRLHNLKSADQIRKGLHVINISRDAKTCIVGLTIDCRKKGLLHSPPL